MDNYFIFDGKRSYSMGIELQGPVSVSGATPNVTEYRIPGRNGKLHEWDGTYTDRSISASCYMLSHMAPKEIREASAWLLGGGYKKLVLSEDEEHFYLARAVSGIPENVRIGLLNPFYVEFSAKPQKFLLSGEREISADKTIYNPTAQNARPIIKIRGSGDATVTVNTAKITCKGLTSTETVILDTETGNAMTSAWLNANNKVYYEDEIVLFPGINNIMVSGNAAVTVIPRWFEI